MKKDNKALVFNDYIKYVSLFILTLQNAAFGLSMRYARTRSGDMFSSASTVLIAELIKLLVCNVLVILESHGIRQGLHSIKATVIYNPYDTLKICVPSFLYIIQNNLVYISASNLDAATYQVTYQLKLITTAFFAVLVLKRVLKKWQWLALGYLAVGIALVQVSSQSNPVVNKDAPAQSKIRGFTAILAASFNSGFAEIYFEKMLKGSEISLWIRNVQLSLFSIPFGGVTYFLSGGTTNDLFKGYDLFVWYLVLLQAGGGLIVAIVVKYVDNILKGFATSLAILISCIVSIYLSDFILTLPFSLGTCLVITSIFLYSYEPEINDPLLTEPLLAY